MKKKRVAITGLGLVTPAGNDVASTWAALQSGRLGGAGLDNVGIVLQSYLKRTLTDIAELRDLRPSVRLCKGIYVEPAAIAFQDSEVVRRSFVSCLDALIEARGATTPR